MWTCPNCNREFQNINQNHFCQGAGKPATVDEYIACQAEAVRPVLEEVRACIRAAVPEAAEKLAWQMPSYRQAGKYVIHFAAFQHHLGIYPGDLDLSPFAERVKALGVHRTARALQFDYDKPVDLELIADIARWRVQSLAGEE